MKINGSNIEEEIDCWCGFKSKYHHFSRFSRKDGKLTIWYKCNDSHRTPVDINYKSTVKEKPIKVKKEKKYGKTKETEVPT